MHACGFYVHIEQGNCFLGAGIWRPDSKSLGMIRDRINEKSRDWVNLMSDKTFLKNVEISAESLLRAPRGFDINHPLIDDLKRKDFIAISNINDAKILSKQFKPSVIKHFEQASDYMRFLCKALELNY